MFLIGHRDNLRGILPLSCVVSSVPLATTVQNWDARAAPVGKTCAWQPTCAEGVAPAPSALACQVALRREHPALQRFTGLRLLETHNDALMAYARGVGADTVITVVNLDPHAPQEGLVTIPYELGVPPVFEVTDLLDETTHTWRMGGNYVRLDPADRPAHVLAVGAHA